MGFIEWITLRAIPFANLHCLGSIFVIPARDQSIHFLDAVIDFPGGRISLEWYQGIDHL